MTVASSTASALPATATARTPHLLRTLGNVLYVLMLVEAFGMRQISRIAHAADYRSFYAAGYLVRTGREHLYDLRWQAAVQNTLVSPAKYALPYVHPPYEAVLYAPFSLLPYTASYHCFLLFNVVLLVLAAAALPELATSRMGRLRRSRVAALLLFVPALVALLQGQDSILFLLLTALAWRTFETGRDRSSGALLGLALFRFQLAVPLFLLLLLYRRRWRLAQGFLAALCTVSAVCWLLAGTQGIRAWLQALSSSSLSHDHGEAIQSIMAIHPLAMPNLFGLLYRLGLEHLQSHAAMAVLLVLSAALFSAAAYRILQARSAGAAFALAVLCSLGVSYHMYLHDLSLLPLALALLRTRAAVLLGATTYVLAALALLLGANSFYLLAVPVLLLVLLPTGPVWPTGPTPPAQTAFFPEPER